VVADTVGSKGRFSPTMVILPWWSRGCQYPSIRVDLFPKVDFPLVTISPTSMGRGPEFIDVDTDRIEGRSIRSTESDDKFKQHGRGFAGHGGFVSNGISTSPYRIGRRSALNPE